MATTLLTPTHIAIVLIVLLLILGPKRLPQTGGALGRGVREFKQAITGYDTDSFAGSDTNRPTDRQTASASDTETSSVPTRAKTAASG